MDKKEEQELELFERRCKENNLKLTPQRFAVYKELLTSKNHPNAEVVYRRLRESFPHISFDTVNRTLLTLCEIGVANVVEYPGGPKRFDPDITLHHHLRCIKCNKLIDFHNDGYDKIEVPDEIQKQFTVLRTKVHLEGICNICINKASK